MDWIVKCEYDIKHDKRIIHRKCPKCGVIRHDIKPKEMYDAYCPDCGQKMDRLTFDTSKMEE